MSIGYKYNNAILDHFFNVAWDVLVFVGKSLFQPCLTTDQVCHELALRNIELSPSEVEYLGRKFILYLALAHRQATPRIEQTMKCSGGYILHLDATHEGDAPVLMTGMDGLKQIVLGNRIFASCSLPTIGTSI